MQLPMHDRALRVNLTVAANATSIRSRSPGATPGPSLEAPVKTT